MSSTPILSYKKPHKESTPSSNASTPRSSYSPNLSSNSQFQNSNNQQQSQSQSQQPTRKISSRRKALQEFYHLQSQQASKNTTNETINNNDRNEPDEASITKTDAIESSSPSKEPKIETIEDVNNFIKNSSIKEILVLRNKIQSKLDSSSQKKKEIIYNNYYELIKLSHMLEDITNSNKKLPITNIEKNNKLSGFKIYEEHDNDENDLNSADKYINEVLEDLSQFNKNQISNFTEGGFKEVLKRINTVQNQDRHFSNSSMIGVYNDEQIDEISEEDKTKRINQLNYILSLPDKELSAEEQSKAESMIDQILKSSENEVLNLQLNTIKNRIH
ncbi:uncharacterized protein KGF55_002970 [Candida pseudojiufengensis]|uniref:uncharacterized protein n=1 Tax=Candida pseudojiufengensis TaxID=497109 RepID=UPI002225B543|nr:uncharacterized protein KGF55_002970 [Candida pseudojiufengensis]KAI5963178.1 hypothetical protein KGF55_002970 [Candida pseudojiufengensis]